MDNNKNKKADFARFLAGFYSDYFTLLVIVVFFVVVMLSYFFIFRPYYVEVTDSKIKENANKEKNVNDLQASIISLENYKRRFDTMDTVKKERLEAVIPSDTNIENLIPWIRKIIEGEIIDGITFGGLGMFLDSVSVSRVEKIKKVSPIPDDEAVGVQGGSPISIDDSVEAVLMNIVVRGVDYDGLKTLLDELEGNLRLMDVQRLNVAGGIASLEIMTYILPNVSMIPKSGGNSTLFRSSMPLDIFDSPKFKSLRRIDYEPEDLEVFEGRNPYPFGVNNVESLDKKPSVHEKNVSEEGSLDEVDVVGDQVEVENVQI